MRRLALFASLLVLAACGDATGPGQGIAGTWHQQFDIPGSGLRFTLVQQDTLVTGSGTFQAEAGPSGTVTVRGTYRAPAVSLQLSFQDGRLELFTGALNGTRMTGTIAAAGGPALQAIFVRD